MPEMAYRPVNRYLPPRPRKNSAGDTGAAAALTPVDHSADQAGAPGVPPGGTGSRLLDWVDSMLSR